MSLEATKVEVQHLKLAHLELRQDIKDLTKQVTQLNTQLHEIRYGRRWLLGMLSASALAGALADTILRIFKLV